MAFDPDAFLSSAQPVTGGFDPDAFLANSEPVKPKGRTIGGVAGDVGVTALKAAVGLPQAIVGLADIPTGGHVGKALEGIGVNFGEAQKVADTLYSEPQQEANRKVAEAKGFGGKISAALKNPSVIATSIGESIPQMIGGAGIARGLLKAGVTAAPWLSGAIGEGVMGAGSAEESLREQSPDGLTTAKQSLSALGSGLGTAAFGALGGKVASSKVGQKLGLADIDTLLAQGGPTAATAAAAKQGFIKQLVASGISEGALEEMPQSMQEQAWQNYSTGKPMMEGVPEAGGMGLLVGGVMGAAGGGYNSLAGQKQNQPIPQDVEQAPEAQPFTPEVTPEPPAGFTPEEVAAFQTEQSANQDRMNRDLAIQRGMAEVNPATNEIQQPAGPLESAAKMATGIPLTAEGAQRRAEHLTAQGQAVQVVPHPKAAGKFQVEQGEQNGTTGQETTQVAETSGWREVDNSVQSVPDVVATAGNTGGRVSGNAGGLDTGNNENRPVPAESAGNGAVITQPTKEKPNASQMQGQEANAAQEVKLPAIALETPAGQQSANTRTATQAEKVISEKAQPVLDLNKQQTGWKRIEGRNNDSVTLVSFDGKRAVDFKSIDTKSGSASVRMNAEAHAFAIDNPYSGSPSPQGELISKPIYTQPAPLPTDTSAPSPAIASPAAQPGVAAAPTKKSIPLTKEAATRLARQFTTQDTPTYVVPHPTAEGMYALYNTPATTNESSVSVPKEGIKKPNVGMSVAAKPITSPKFTGNLINDIRKMGGVSQEHIRDITGESSAKNVKGGGFLFRKTGRNLDQLATSLKDIGYSIDTESADGGKQQLMDMMRDAMNGNAVMTPQAAESKANEQAAKEYRANLAEKAKARGINIVGKRTERIEEELQELEAEKEATRAKLSEEAEKEYAAISAAVDASQGVSSKDMAESDIDALFNLEVPNESQRPSSEVTAGPAKTNQEASRNKTQGAKTNAGTGEFSLAQQTEAEITAAEKAKAEAEAKAQEESAKAEQKRKADAEVNSFALEGQGISSNQDDMFGNSTRRVANRRDPTKVSVFNPYEDGDTVSIGGKDWQVKQDMNGWYLTDTGNWRGTHPTVKNIMDQIYLIRAIEQTAIESSPVAKKATTVSEKATVQEPSSVSIRKSSIPLDEIKRNNIAKSDMLYKKYGDQSEGGRGRFKQSARNGDFDHLIGELSAHEDAILASQKDAQREKNQKWKDKNLPRLYAEKRAREQAEEAAKVERVRSFKDHRVEKYDKEIKLTNLASTRKETERYKTGRTIKRRITADDPSIYGSHLLGMEGEYYNFPEYAYREKEVNTSQEPEQKTAESVHIADAGKVIEPARRFTNDGGDTLNEAERELRTLARDIEQPGDVLLGNGRYAPFSDVVRLAREGIESGTFKPWPAQLNFNLDIAMRDVDRVLAAAQKPAQEGKSEEANTRDRFTLERLNHETNQMAPVSFERGEYVRYTLSGNDAFGEIDGISQAKREFSVDGLWYPFGFAYKAEKPAEYQNPTVPLSSVIESANKKFGADLGYADRIHTLAVQSDLFKRIHEGSVTADEFKAAFDALLKNKGGITAELNGMTKAGIFSKFPGLEYRYKNEKKADLVEASYRSMLDDFVLGDSIQWSYGQKYEDVIQSYVDRTTEDQLKEFAEKVKASRADRAERVAQFAEAVKDPKTLEDFNAYMRAKFQELGEGTTFGELRMTLTPEQRGRFDELAADKSRGERKDRADQQKTEVRVAAQTTTGQIVETKHTKTGQDLFVVKAAERVERDVYNQWNATAKRLGGWYSPFRGNGAIPGFQFKTRENADAFLKFLGGDTVQAQEAVQARRDAYADDKSQSAVERLNEMADSLEEKADASLSQDRKANTSRRARFAASAEADANYNKAMAQTMRNIAVGIENGTAKFLDRVRQKVQVEMMSGFVRTAQDDMHRKLYPTYGEQENHKGEKPTQEVSDYATFPSYTAYRSDLASLGRALLEAEGTKKLGQRMMKVADDISDAYLKFAKENLHKVSTFSTKDGKSATFLSKPAAEEAIARSGYKGAAIVLPFKRGQNIIILSPSEAIKRGVWSGDNDKRITLSSEFGEELVERLGKLNRSGRMDVANAFTRIPWQFENAFDKRKRLSAMGIETPAEFRAALREFIGLKEAPKEADKIKEMERAMIGRKNDGLDFFPTPSATADEMIETADIKDGMSVLEPSAGMGHIADRIRESGAEPDVVELSNERKELLEAKGYNVVGRDFMDVTEGAYDRIVMNPPFSDGRAAQHVQHAYELLKSGGRVVALVDEGVFFRQDKKAQAFRDWLEQVGATNEKLEEGTFNDPSLPVNTGVNARMLVIDKPDGPQGGNETDKGTKLYSKSAKFQGDSGLGDATIKPAKSIKPIADILASENAEQVSVSGGNSDVLREVANRFGKHIIYFRSNLDANRLQNEGLGVQVGGLKSDAGTNREGGDIQEEEYSTDGFVNTGRPDLIFLNVESPNHLLYILGHETGHTLRLDDPKLWSQMAKKLQPLIKNWSRYKADMAVQFSDETANAEELFGDMIGDNFLNETFWNDLAQQDKTLFQNIAGAVIKLLNKALSLMVGKDVSVYVTDMEQARAVISSVMKQYADNASKGMYGVYAKQLDQDYINKRMVAWHGSPHDHNKFDVSITAKYSRNIQSTQQPGLSVADVHAITDPIIAKWKHGKVNIAQSSAEIPGEATPLLSSLSVDQADYYRALSKKIHALRSLEEDDGTNAHERATGALAAALSRKLGLAPSRSAEIALAAQIHDIGKTKVPSEILHKNGPLTTEEFSIIKQHVPLGREILIQHDITESIVEIVEHHHRNWNPQGTKGVGYPAGNDFVSFGAQIVHLADVVSSVGYADPGHSYVTDAGLEKALTVIEENPGQFNPDVVAAFKVLVDENHLPGIFRQSAEMPEAGFADVIEGAYLGNGEIWLAANSFTNKERVLQVLSHEGIGHMAAEELTNQGDYQRAIASVQTLDRMGNKTIRALGQKVDERQPGLDKATRAKEIMALSVEDGSYKNIPLLQKAITKITAWIKLKLRALGLEFKWVNSMTEGEIFGMLRDAEAKLYGKTPVASTNRGSMSAQLNSAKSPAFYSELTRSIAGMSQNKAMPGQWLGIINNLTTKGVKNEEIEWSGVRDWLAQQNESVTREQLLDYIRSQNVEVKEVMLGGDGATSQSIAREIFEEEWSNGDFSDWMNESLREEASNAWDDPNHKVWESLGRDRSFYEDDFKDFRSDVIDLGIDDVLTEIEINGAKEEAWRQFEPDYEQKAAEINNNNREYAEFNGGSPTKFASYKLPGGENYRELLLTMPQKKPSSYDIKLRGQMEYKQDEAGKWNIWDRDGWVFRNGFDTLDAVKENASGDDQLTYVPDTNNFKSSHFDQPNILAHVRFDERTDDKGRRVLHMAELQSDWGQKGKKEGFDNEARFEQLIAQRDNATDAATRNALQRQIDDMQRNSGKGVPTGPFVTSTKSWAMLAMKRMIRYASEHNFEAISWDVGATQADRYDLSKQVKEIEYIKRGDKYELGITQNNGDGLDLPQSQYSAKELEDVVGKDIAQKIVDGEGKKYRGHEGITLEGLDLKVGGEGMSGFYDNILPNLVNKYVKQWGTKVEPSSVSTMEQTKWNASKTDIVNESTAPAHSVTITTAMRQSAMSGQPLFSVYQASGGYRIYQDPTRQQAENLLARSQAGNMRALRDPETGTLYMWDAAYAIHHMVARELGISAQHYERLEFDQNELTKLPDGVFSDETGYGSVIAGRPGDMTAKEFNLAPKDFDRLFGQRAPLYSKSPNAGWQAPESVAMDSVIYTLQDKNIDLKRVQQNIKAAGKKIEDSINPYLQEELFHGRVAKRTKDFVTDELEPMIAEMRMRGVTMADFEEYLWMRHAEERNAQIAKVNPDMPDGGSGISNKEAGEYFKNITQAKRKSYESLAKRVDAINAKTGQTLVDYALESQDTIDAWGKAYNNYVPLMREGMEHEFGNGTGQGFSVRGNSSKRATGSNRAVVDIIANMAQQRERALIRGEKDRVSVALVGLAQLNPNPEFWKVDQPPKIKTVNDSTGLVEERTDPLFKSRDNVIVARTNENGKIVEHAVIFNERNERAMRMAAALKNLDQDQIGELLGNASVATRYIASINTQYNPVFGVMNLTRDVGTAMLNLSSTPLAGKRKEVLGHTISALRGIYSDIRALRAGKHPTSQWAAEFEEFQREGGQTGYRDMFKNARDRAEAIEKAMDETWWQKTLWGKVLTANGFLSAPEQMLADKAVKPVFEWLSDYNETMENAVRLAAYRVAKESGMSKQQAASLAKNLTVNFNRKGQVGRQVGSLYAFFNASVQGTARMAETLKGPAGKRIIYGGLLLGAMQAMALAAAGFDDDEPPDFVRDRNIIIPIGDGKYTSIPMPLGFNILPAFGRIMTEFAISGFKEPQKRITHLIDVMADSFNPIGNAGISMQTIAPSVLDPFAALAENKDWTGKPIARENFNSLAPTPGFTRAKDTATVFSKALAKAINYMTGGTDYKPGAFSPTPDQIDYLIGQVTGGVGREASKAEQTVLSMASGEDMPTYKIPLVGRLYGDTTGQSSQGSKFYENLKLLNEHEAEIKGRRTHGENVAEYVQENPDARFVMLGNHAEREVSKLRKEKRMLVERGASPEIIKNKDAQITAVMKNLNDRLKQAKTAAA